MGTDLEPSIDILDSRAFKETSAQWLDQGTLYTREGYGTICAVVNQL